MTEVEEQCFVCEHVLHDEAGLRRHLFRVRQVVLDAKPRGRPRTRKADLFRKPDPVVSHSAPVLTKRASSKKPSSIAIMFGDVDPAVVTAISVATHGILEQHDSYNMMNLIFYVETNYVTIPSEIIQYVILSATSAAWYVAQKFYVRERYINSAQEHQVSAENISNSMLGWFTNLRSEKSTRCQTQISARSASQSMTGSSCERKNTSNRNSRNDKTSSQDFDNETTIINSS